MPDLRVLVVEDDPDAAELIAVVVEGLGCRCEIAATCAAARALIASYPPDIAILDRHLGDGSGLALARALRRSASGPVYVIAFSGTADVVDEVDAQLLKPASPALLRETVIRAAQYLRRGARS